MMKGCATCGYRKNVNALHLHHRDRAAKEIKVSQLNRYGRPKIKAELAKCDVLCANCHAEHHDGELN